VPVATNITISILTMKPQEREKYFVLSNTRYLPADEAALLPGRIVRRVDEPINGGYAPEDPRPYHLGKNTTIILDDANGSLTKSEQRELRAGISNAFLARGNATNTFISRLRGRIAIVTLRQSQDVFDKLAAGDDQRVQALLKALLEGKSKQLYMIVGYIQVGAATVVSSETSSTTEVGLSAKVPVGSVAAATGGLPLLHEVGDVEGSAKVARSQNQTVSGSAGAGDVCAIAYTAIRRTSRFTTAGIKRSVILDDEVRLNFGSHGYSDEGGDAYPSLMTELLFDEDYEEAVGDFTSVDLDEFDLIFPGK
jgi:hypothetical protein